MYALRAVQIATTAGLPSALCSHHLCDSKNSPQQPVLPPANLQVIIWMIDFVVKQK